MNANQNEIDVYPLLIIISFDMIEQSKVRGVEGFLHIPELSKGK